MSTTVEIIKRGTTTVNVTVEQAGVDLNLALPMVAPMLQIDVLAGGGVGSGDSAYQVAVRNGFVGTEAEWLASLHGADGDQGPPGDTTPYVHTQAVEAAEWIVNHNLGHRPAGVEVLSPGGLSILAEIVHTSVNQLRIYFASPQTGSVSAL